MTKNLFHWIFLLLVLGSAVAVADGRARTAGEDEETIQVGVGAFADGFYDVAEHQLTRFVKDFGSHEKVFQASYLLGKTFFYKGKYREARASFWKIINDVNRFEYIDYTLFWAAQAEIRLGDLEAARKLLLILIKRFPKFEWIDYTYCHLGLIDVALRNPGAAETSLKKTLELTKKGDVAVSARFWLGILCCGRGDFAAGATYLRAVWEGGDSAFPEYRKMALLWLSEALRRMGRFEEARSGYRTFCERFGEDPRKPQALWAAGFCEYRLGKNQEAIETLESIKSLWRETTPLLFTHYLLGEIFLAGGDHGAAGKEFTALLSKGPSLLTGASLLALYWNAVLLGETDEANRIFHRLLRPNSSEDEKAFVQWLTAERASLDGRTSDALPFYFNVLNTRFRERSLYRIGKGYFLDEKLREAITNLDLLLLEFPNSRHRGEGLFLKGESLVRMGQGDLALGVFTLLLGEKKHGLWDLLASVEMGFSHPGRNGDEMEGFLLRAVAGRFSGHPLSDVASYQLGNIAFKKRNEAEALRHYSQVIERGNPALLGETLFRLGETFCLRHRYEKALQCFEDALKHLHPDSPWFALAHLERANLYRRWGEMKNAIRSYRVAVKRSKDEELKRTAAELLKETEAASKGR